MSKQLWVMRHSIRQDFSTGTSIMSDPNITDEGLILAANIGKELGKLAKIAIIDSSPYSRALQTSMIISPILNAPIMIEPTLAEWIPPMSNYKPLPKPLLSFLNSNDISFPESETCMIARCTTYLDNFTSSPDQTPRLAITHGAIINNLTRLIIPEYKFDPNASADVYIPGYCDYIGFEYDINNHKWKLLNTSWKHN